MYYRWIAELESYQPYTIKHVPGKDHVDADALSRIRRICGYENCPHCLQWRQKNRKCRGSDSEDSVTDSLNHIAWLRPRNKPPDPEEIWLKMVPDRPDLGDYASYDLLYIVISCFKWVYVNQVCTSRRIDTIMLQCHELVVR